MSLFDQDVFFFTTFGGEALSLAASKVCIEFIRDRDVTDHIARLGQQLQNGLNATLAHLGLEGVSVAGYPCRTIVNFSPAAGDPLEMKTLVQQELLRRGILWSGTHNICHAHSEADVAYTLAAYADALAMLREALEAGSVRRYLQGETIQPVFRKTAHFNTRPRRVPEPAVPGTAAEGGIRK